MKKIIIAALVITACLYIACSKNNILPVSGSINGTPAITLYGSSKEPSDYVFVAASKKEMSYNGDILTYIYTGTNSIFMVYSGSSIGRGTLDTSASKTILTIDSTYGFTFASTTYTSN